MTLADEFPETQVPVAGGSIALHSVGSGEGIVLVHGAMQNGHSQRDLADLLAPDFRVHLMDRRGREGVLPRWSPIPGSRWTTCKR